MVQEFLDIQRIRHRVDSQLEEAVDGEAEKLCIPPLSLLTFVENAVKHGGRSRALSIQIKVELIRQNGGKRLRLSVQDTGVGFPPEILEAANSSHLGRIRAIWESAIYKSGCSCCMARITAFPFQQRAGRSGGVGVSRGRLDKNVWI